jgi:hypothetical protein
MGYTRTTARSLSGPSVRRHLTMGVTFASASILTLGLVTVPPEVDVARTEVRAVRLAAFPLPQGASLALDQFIRDQAQSFVAVAKVAGGGAADIPDAVLKVPMAATAPVTVDSSTDPATNPQNADATALAATTTALAIPSVFAPIAAVLGILLLFGPLIVLVILACPPCALINVLSYIPSFFGIYLPVPVLPLAAATTADVAEIDATVAPTLTSDPPLQGNETEKNDVPEPVTSIDKRTRAEDAESTDTVQDVTETVAVEGVSTAPTTVSDPVSGEDASELTKPSEPKKPTTPRPVVRNSLGAGERVREAAKDESSSATAPSEGSPSTERKTSGDDDSSGGDADGA